MTSIAIKLPMAWFGRCFVTHFLALSLIVPQSTLAAGGGHELSARELDEIEVAYQKCKVQAREQLTAAEMQEISLFRQKLAIIQPVFLTRREQINSDFMNNFNQTMAAIPEDISDRLYPRYLMLIAEQTLNQLMSISLGLKYHPYRRYIRLVEESLLYQRPINLAELDRLHMRISTDVIAFFKSQKNLPVQYQSTLLVTHSLLSQQVASIQLQNALVTGDRDRARQAFAQSALYGLFGVGAFTSTFILTPIAFAKGGAIAANLGASLLTGHIAAGNIAGALGGGGLHLAYEEAVMFHTAHSRSQELGSPFSCELHRAIAFSHPGRVLMEGALIGALTGGVLAAAGQSPNVGRKLLGAIAWTTRFGIGLEGSYTGYYFYKTQEYGRLAKALQNLPNVPEQLRDVQEALTRSVLAEKNSNGKMVIEHGSKTLALTLLQRAFNHHRPEALHDVVKAKEVLAHASDSVNTVGQTIFSAASGSIYAILQTRAAPKKSTSAEAREFIQTVKKRPIRTSEMEPTDWQFQMTSEGPGAPVAPLAP